MAEIPDPSHPVLASCAAGTMPANVAILRLSMELQEPDEVDAALARAWEAASAEPRAQAAARRLKQALDLWRRTPQAFATVKAVLDGVEHGGVAAPGQGLTYWSETFDRLAGVAPDGGVALYALGDPDLLQRATGEVVDWLAKHGLLGPSRRVLEIGCGNGRFVAALAPRVAGVRGLDISAGMIARARERCAGLANVSLGVSSGRDLGEVGDATMDLVLAADVFPYLVQAGEAERHVAEAARVLRRGGHLAILNYSYGGDRARDHADVAAAAARSGLDLRRAALGDFALWDAQSFLLRKG